MAIELKFRIEPADDDAAEICVGFKAPGFEGESRSWIRAIQIRDFIQDLSKYPLDPKSLPVLSGGFWDPTGSRVTQEHVHISAEPKDSLGNINLTVRLAVPCEGTAGPKIKLTASANITSNYGQLSDICRELDSLACARVRDVTFVFER